MESLFHWISQYGYVGLFALLVLGIVGLPIPDETLLVFSGYLISRGRFQPLITFLVTFGGAVSGISISYLLGATLGHAAVERYGRFIHLTPQRLELVHQWFQKVGNLLLSVGYFIPGVRHFTAVVAGMSGLEYKVFAAFAYTGAAVWVSLFLTLGYWFGERWPLIIEFVHRYTWLAAAIAGCAILAVFLLKRRQPRMRKG